MGLPMPPTGPSPPRRGRSRRERLAIAGAVLAAGLCFASAGSLAIGYAVVRDRTDPELAARALVPAPPDAPPPATAETTRPTVPDTTVVPSPPPPPVFPPTTAGVFNLLVIGIERCGGGGAGDETAAAPGADLVMMMRVDGASRTLTMLSFPPELHLPQAGQLGRDALGASAPEAIPGIIYENFAIVTDHVLQVDRCAFTTLVDAIGGVTIPFRRPARDLAAGLDVPEPGCVTLDGAAAVAYVGAQRYEYRRPGDGVWTPDPSGATGRMSRQQELLERALAGLVSAGALSPDLVARLLGQVAGGGLVTSPGLTADVLVDVAGIARDLGAASIPNYRIEAGRRRIGTRTVLVPRIDGENMQAILRLFRSEGSTPEELPRGNVVGVIAPADDDCP